MQIDGGATFTEPTAIIAGVVEGLEDVSWGQNLNAVLNITVPLYRMTP